MGRWRKKLLDWTSIDRAFVTDCFRCEAGTHPCGVDSMDASVSSLNTCFWRNSGKPVRGWVIVPELTLILGLWLLKSELSVLAGQALEPNFIQTKT